MTASVADDDSRDPMASMPLPPRRQRGGWFALPLYVQIIIGVVAGVALALVLRNYWTGNAATAPGWLRGTLAALNETARIVLQLLTAVAPPLLMVAVVRAILVADIGGRSAWRLVYLLLLNTLVAISIGLLVANLIRPGAGANLLLPEGAKPPSGDPLRSFLEKVPSSFVAPLVENNIIGVVLIAIAVGVAGRSLAADQRALLLRIVEVITAIVLKVLMWVLLLVPLAVFCKVAYLLTTQGLAPFRALAWFVLSVVAALCLMAVYYLARIALFSWVSPARVISGSRDALVMAFSTASSTATMPVTYTCLVDRVGVRPRSASMGSLVGANFNNDGTALYEAMSALFIAQAIGADLSLGQQLVVVITSVVAALGAAGIPEAAFVTMTLVFNAVGLPVAYVALLLPVDWFLDRCRTAINVLGDINVSCILDGKTAPSAVDDRA